MVVVGEGSPWMVVVREVMVLRSASVTCTFQSPTVYSDSLCLTQIRRIWPCTVICKAPRLAIPLLTNWKSKKLVAWVLCSWVACLFFLGKAFVKQVLNTLKTDYLPWSRRLDNQRDEQAACDIRGSWSPCPGQWKTRRNRSPHRSNDRRRPHCPTYWDWMWTIAICWPETLCGTLKRARPWYFCTRFVSNVWWSGSWRKPAAFCINLSISNVAKRLIESCAEM